MSLTTRFHIVVASTFTLAACCFAGEVQLTPVAATGSHVITGNDIQAVAGTRITFEIRIRGWDPALSGNVLLKNYQIRIDRAGFTSGATGALTVADEACVGNNAQGRAQCEAAFGGGAGCGYPGTDLRCTPLFMDRSHPDWVFGDLEPDVLSAANLFVLEFGATSAVGGPSGVVDDGTPEYAGTLVLDVSQNASGVFTVGFIDTGHTFFQDQNGDTILPVPVRTPATITIVPCAQHADCADHDECTIDHCDAGQCTHTSVQVPPGSCCDPTDSSVAEDIAGSGQMVPNADDNPCTLDTCSISSTVGQPIHPPGSNGLACDDADPCTTNDRCQNGQCLGDNVEQIPCQNNFDCELAAGTVFACSPAGHCLCNEPCCLGDGRCMITAAGGCAAQAGIIVIGCQGDTDGNGLDQACEVPCCLPDGRCEGRTLGACASVGGVVTSGCLPDNDQDGVSDGCQGDCNHNGVLDIDEPLTANQDCDGDGICNSVEVGQCGVANNCDCNHNGIPDLCEPDCNNNGIADPCEFPAGDSDGNGVLDDCEADCNGNGISDGIDIASGFSDDCQPDGIPDECEPSGACCYHPFGGLTCFPTSKFLCEVYYGGVWRGPCAHCESIQDTTQIDEGGTIFFHRIGNPLGCPEPSGGLLARDCSSTSYFDAWTSIPGGGVMCEEFGTPDSPALPADFFAPGSDPFTGTICYKGTPLGLAGLGDADTIISRSADPFDRCSLPSPAPGMVQVDIVQLSLDSVNPIVVTYNGGGGAELWNVHVGLSSVTPPSGTLTATKTHCNGGTYSNTLNVLPKLTFTKVNDPGTTRTLDTGLAGQSPITLSATDQPWVHDTDEVLGVLGDPCSKFRPGVVQIAPTTDCDCNGNQLRDDCDIESQSSADCNQNRAPDECDVSLAQVTDCNGNFIPDECEPDCNHNSVADACDLLSQTSSDINANAIPDECERGVTPGTADVVAKHRYLSIRPGGPVDGSAAAIVQAIRVKSPNFPGLVKWVGPPDAARISRLQCAPHYANFGFAMLHVGDADIMPAKVYEVQGILQGAPIGNAVAYSSPATTIATPANWGDIVGVQTASGWSSPNGVTNIIDVVAVVDTFRQVGKYLPVPRGDIAPRVPDEIVNILDIAATVDGFKGLPYSFGAPSTCP